ncbi:MAG: DUF971 domain-containing protein [Phycisphaerales bacterium]|nr:DUF971 domain-containing protein [Phycisphaerales bacterium]
MLKPKHLDLKKDTGLTIEWEDGSTSFYTIAYLRRNSPAADARKLREEMASNPLAVLPADVADSLDKPLIVLRAELVGNYAVHLIFSDGHDSGIYSWDHLRRIDPQRTAPEDEQPT